MSMSQVWRKTRIARNGRWAQLTIEMIRGVKSRLLAHVSSEAFDGLQACNRYGILQCRCLLLVRQLPSCVDYLLRLLAASLYSRHGFAMSSTTFLGGFLACILTLVLFRRPDNIPGKSRRRVSSFMKLRSRSTDAYLH